MLKHIIFGDIHGRNNWYPIVKKYIDDNNVIFVFIGDYFDSFDLPVNQQITVFNHILSLKDEYPERFILLFGNHDYHYLSFVTEKYPGYSPILQMNIGYTLDSAFNKRVFDVVYQYDNVLFSHAGITKTFIKNYGIKNDKYLTIKLNELLYYKPNAFCFNNNSINDFSGDDINQSPLWVRPNSLSKDYIKGYKQVVGHTVQKDGVKVIKNKIYIVDCLWMQYLVYENNDFEIVNI